MAEYLQEPFLLPEPPVQMDHLPDLENARLSGLPRDDAIAVSGLHLALGLGGKFHHHLAVVELVRHPPVGAEQFCQAVVRNDKGPVLPEPEAVADAPVDRKDALPQIVITGHFPAGHLVEQSWSLDQAAAAIPDAIEIELDFVAAAAERHRNEARIFGPERVIGIGCAVEVVVRSDLVQRHKLAMPGFGHQPDMEIALSAIAFAMGGERHLL